MPTLSLTKLQLTTEQIEQVEEAKRYLRIVIDMASAVAAAAREKQIGLEEDTDAYEMIEDFAGTIECAEDLEAAEFLLDELLGAGK